MSSVATAPAPSKVEGSPMSSEIAKADRTPPVITTPDEFQSARQRWEGQNFHLLVPFTNISGLAPQHGILTSVIRINPDPTVGEVYAGLPFLKDGEKAIAKNGLRRIAEGLGVSIDLRHVSVGQMRHYWHVVAMASYRGIDGAPVRREASMEWDLRDGSDRLKGWTEKQISEARKHGLRACETRAINAAIRECGTGIKQKYSAAELARPFIAVRVMHTPDMSDPEIRKLVTQSALQGTQALYLPQGGVPGPAQVRNAFETDEEPPLVGRGATPAAVEQAEPAAAPEGLRVVKVDQKHGETNGRKWCRYVVVFSHGLEASTFDQKIGQLAIEAVERKAVVRIETFDNDRGTDLKALAIAETQVVLPIDGDRL